MSEEAYWEKKPNVSNQFKGLIDGIFDEQHHETEEAPKVQEVKPKKHKVKIPEPPQQTKEQEVNAAKHAKDEMEDIRKAFLAFTDSVNDTVLYSYLYPYIEDFVEKCRQMQVLVGDEIDKDKLSEHGLNDYEQMKKIRGTILSEISNRYNKKD